MNHRTIYNTDHTEPNKELYQFAGAHLDPNGLLETILDNIHDGDKDELTGNLILMLGWLHKGGTMPNISKDTVTTTTLWIIPTND
jgi:hypothetical protein